MHVRVLVLRVWEAVAKGSASRVFEAVWVADSVGSVVPVPVGAGVPELMAVALLLGVPVWDRRGGMRA